MYYIQTFGFTKHQTPFLEQCIIYHHYCGQTRVFSVETVLESCVCVRVRVRMSVCVCVCVRVRALHPLMLANTADHRCHRQHNGGEGLHRTKPSLCPCSHPSHTSISRWLISSVYRGLDRERRWPTKHFHAGDNGAT